MNHEPVTSVRSMDVEPGGPLSTPADTDGRLDWDKAIRLAWRPAWSIRSRRGAGRALAAWIRGLLRPRD
ncbi:MAG: hypothetical protein AAGB15_08150 [Pseudomonadota bacterium]